MSPVASLHLLFALAVPMTAALVAAAAPAPRIALEGKYVVGRLIAVIALIVALPILLAIALAVLLTSRGAVLFRQQRVGEGGETFAMLKFRSMRSPRASDAAFVPSSGSAPGGIEGVDRRTVVGRFIRRTSLDELPQLWNVVRGDMCLVGPRPERPEHVARLSGEIPGYAHRHRVRVGLTGLAQVEGARGAGSCMTSRAQLDNAYIDQWSLGLDARILGRTVGAVLRGAE
jgi:lipopolysaccharide/colanic/teichoic acid biosynthesis glycosyltransferase